MPSTIQKSFKQNNKDVKYLNKDFSELKTSLINFAKSYFPNSYKDFSDSSVGNMFIEMSAYVGDVLSYYTDYAFKESMFLEASERKNIIAMARYLGYKVKPAKASTCELDIYQLIPAIDDGTGNIIPDDRFALSIRENMQISTEGGSFYLLSEPVNFSVNTKQSPREVSVYLRDDAGVPIQFLIKKTSKVTSGKILKKEVFITNAQPFYKINLDEDNVLEILDIYDSDNNKWYEVDYLAQELVLDSVPNNEFFDGTYKEYSIEVPYILKYLRTSRRYVTSVNQFNKTTIEFGSGTEGFGDELINLNSESIGRGLSKLNKLNIPLNPNSFLKTETYGLAPSNTTLTIRYVVGGGIESNCNVGEIKNINSVEFENSDTGMLLEDLRKLNDSKKSLRISNISPATGGAGAEENESIKMNALSFFSAQNRAVTREDYIVRAYSMPQKYGSISKVQAITSNSLTVNTNRILTGTVNVDNEASVNNNNIDNYFRKINYDISNPFSINLYILSYDSNKKLTTSNQALVNNLLKYLKQFRIMTDGINIIDGFVINIGVDFSISVYKGYNKKEVMLNCISAAQSFFNIDEWSFSQPININQLELEIAKTEGVQSVPSLKIKNLTVLDGNYSPVEYDIANATKNNIIYPSVDPSVFEVKYPESDIKCSVV